MISTDKELWAIKLTMGKLKPHIVTMVETGMNVIRSEAYASVIRRGDAPCAGVMNSLADRDRVLVAGP
jgi:hypothetical protein